MSLNCCWSSICVLLLIPTRNGHCCFFTHTQQNQTDQTQNPLQKMHRTKQNLSNIVVFFLILLAASANGSILLFPSFAQIFLGCSSCSLCANSLAGERFVTFNAGLAVGLDPYALERLDNIDYALQRLSVLLSASLLSSYLISPSPPFLSSVSSQISLGALMWSACKDIGRPFRVHQS